MCRRSSPRSSTGAWARPKRATRDATRRPRRAAVRPTTSQPDPNQRSHDAPLSRSEVMQSGESAEPAGTARALPVRLFKKRIPEEAPVTARSMALFRFGEQCNNHCPMCSNTGEAALFFHRTDELLRRADFLHGCGFQRVVVTGGEATIHPGFWTVIERLAAHPLGWDGNTSGRPVPP